MTNDQIAQIVSAVNTGEIQIAHHALKTSKNSEVKTFARHMITDHTVNNEKVGRPGAKLNTIPATATPLTQPHPKLTNQLNLFTGKDIFIF